jgi:Sensors of blue-light using FAD
MHLSQLVYISRSVDADLLTTGKILSAARRFNGANDISGFLLFDGTYYLQRLEGARALISLLYSKISLDPRHTDITILAAGPIAVRQCPGWAMGYIDDREVVTNAVRRFSSSGQLDPYMMSSESAVALVEFLANTPGIVRTSTPT